MTLYIKYYIDPNSVEVKTIKGDRHDSYQIGNTHVHMDAGQPVLSIDDGRWKQPPAELKDKITRVSIKMVFVDWDIVRAPGKYTLGDAEGYVDKHTNEHKVGSRLEVSAPDKESALALWDAVMKGDIRPSDEHWGSQVEPLIDDDTMQEVRQQAALLARKFLKEEMAKLVAA